MKHLVITGNIGCGKSYIANILKEQWESPIESINMDHETFRFVYGEGKQYLINNFLTTDKRMISSLVFDHPGLLNDLNNHFVGDIKRIFLEYLEQPGPVIIEFPLLFECFATDEEREFIKSKCIIVAVYATDDVRFKRATERDAKTIEQVRKVDASQMPQSQKYKLADWVIINQPTNEPEQLVKDLIDVLHDRVDYWYCRGILRPAQEKK